METFAQRITKRRIQLKLTQRQVAEALCIPLSTYKEWEYGRRVQGEAVYVKLSEILNINLRTLLTGELNKNGKEKIQRIQSAIEHLSEIKELLLSFL